MGALNRSTTSRSKVGKRGVKERGFIHLARLHFWDLLFCVYVRVVFVGLCHPNTIEHTQGGSCTKHMDYARIVVIILGVLHFGRL